MSTGLIIGIVIGVLVVAVIVYNIVVTQKSKKTPDISSEDYIKKNQPK